MSWGHCSDATGISGGLITWDPWGWCRRVPQSPTVTVSLSRRVSSRGRGRLPRGTRRRSPAKPRSLAVPRNPAVPRIRFPRAHPHPDPIP